MSRDIDYGAIEVPPDKPSEELSFSERRAEILQMIRASGNPRSISQYRLAERYGCTQPNISNDFDALEEWIEEHRTDRRTLNLNTTKERVLDGLLDAGEDDWRALRAAFTTALEYDQWLSEREGMDELREDFDALEKQLERLERERERGRDHAAPAGDSAGRWKPTTGSAD